MPRRLDKSLIVALDIGTSKIAALVGEVSDNQEVEVIGFGFAPSHGLKRGVVVNIESTVQSIRKAVEEAELMAGCDINTAYTGIAGSHIHSLNSHGIVAICDHEVNQSDVERVIDAAKALAIPADQKILHILPQEFIIDAQEGIREPVGMSGVRLEAKVHIVTGSVSAAQNITKCVRRCGLHVADLVLEPLASSQAVLSDDEKELGICLVDIGGGTTDIAVFTQGAIRHTHVIPIAGDHVTHDLAVALQTSKKQAEDIKMKQGSVSLSKMDSSQTISVPSVSERPPKIAHKKTLTQVIHARYEELLRLIQDELRQSGCLDFIPAGFVLTGGASNITGILELAESIFQKPARLGMAHNVNGLIDVRKDPSFATGVGLLVHGVNAGKNQIHYDQNEDMQSMWSRMKSWFQKNF